MGPEKAHFSISPGDPALRQPLTHILTQQQRSGDRALKGSSSGLLMKSMVTVVTAILST